MSALAGWAGSGAARLIRNAACRHASEHQRRARPAGRGARHTPQAAVTETLRADLVASGPEGRPVLPFVGPGRRTVLITMSPLHGSRPAFGHQYPVGLGERLVAGPVEDELDAHLALSHRHRRGGGPRTLTAPRTPGPRCSARWPGRCAAPGAPS